MGAKRQKVFIVDAACDDKYSVAGIAIVRRDRDMVLVAIDVVEAKNSNEAELRAVIRALRIAHRQSSSAIHIWSDSGSIVGWLGGKTPVNGFSSWTIKSLVNSGRELLGDSPHKVVLKDRSDTQPAHIAARQGLKAWVAGATGEPTWTA